MKTAKPRTVKRMVKPRLAMASVYGTSVAPWLSRDDATTARFPAVFRLFCGCPRVRAGRTRAQGAAAPLGRPGRCIVCWHLRQFGYSVDRRGLRRASPRTHVEDRFHRHGGAYERP